MADLPLIPLEDPITVAPTQQVVYNAIWVKHFSTNADPGDSVTGGGRLVAEIWPMTSDGTGRVLGGDSTIRIETNRLFQCVNEVPEAAQALGAILLALTKVKAWEEARKAAELENGNP